MSSSPTATAIPVTALAVAVAIAVTITCTPFHLQSFVFSNIDTVLTDMARKSQVYIYIYTYHGNVTTGGCSAREAVQMAESDGGVHRAYASIPWATATPQCSSGPIDVG